MIIGRISDDLSMDYTALGHDVGLAQRMESLAEAGHISLPEHAARLVEGYFQLRDLGRLQVKGVAEPVALFDLEEPARSAPASTAPAPATCPPSSGGIAR